MKYCRRCDLFFCPDHEQHHPDLPGHELTHRPDLAQPFCCVCVGIFLPLDPAEGT